MRTFKEFLAERVIEDINQEAERHALYEELSLFEHETYKRIPKTQSSYRPDPGNTNTNTQPHAHVFAKPKGRGKELYSVNIDGSGHDGSTGIEISAKHADFLRTKNYKISSDNILESISINDLDRSKHLLIIIEDA